MLGDGSFWRSSIHVHSGADRLVLSQGPSVMMQIIVWLLLIVLAFGWLATIGGFLTTQPQHLVCDRAAGTCTLNDRPLAPLADVTGAILERNWTRANGEFWGVVLKMRDGSKRDAFTQRAQSKKSVAEYRAAVDAIRAFLTNPAQTRLDTTYVYRTSVMEDVLGVVRGLVLAVFAVVLVATWNRSSYTFDRGTGKVTASSKAFLRRAKTTQAQIVAIGERSSEPWHYLQLALADGTRIDAVQSKRGAVDPLLAQVAQITGKPLETRR